MSIKARNLSIWVKKLIKNRIGIILLWSCKNCHLKAHFSACMQAFESVRSHINDSFNKISFFFGFIYCFLRLRSKAKWSIFVRNLTIFQLFSWVHFYLDFVPFESNLFWDLDKAGWQILIFLRALFIRMNQSFIKIEKESLLRFYFVFCLCW